MAPVSGHLGFFKRAYLPTSRGFDRQSGLYNAQGDHYEHTIDGGYDWHVDEQTRPSFRGRYSGNLVRDDAVAFVKSHAVSTPFFLYVAFQEVKKLGFLLHSPRNAHSIQLTLTTLTLGRRTRRMKWTPNTATSIRSWQSRQTPKICTA